MKIPDLHVFQKEAAQKLAKSIRSRKFVQPKFKTGIGQSYIVCRAAQLVYPRSVCILVPVSLRLQYAEVLRKFSHTKARLITDSTVVNMLNI